MQHYFSENPDSSEKVSSYDITIFGEKFTFHTNSSVFSKSGLDFGSKLLIETVAMQNSNWNGKLLDVGCGYGPISICLGRFWNRAKISMIDINSRAIDMAKQNIIENKIENIGDIRQSDVFSSVTELYDMILTNPPIRAGKTVVFAIYDGAYDHLLSGGKLYVVIQKKQGAPSSIEKLNDLFGNCEIVEKKAGYFILYSIKN